METSSASPGLRSFWREGWPLIFLLLTGIVVGLWFGNDYGISLDEGVNAETGEQAILAYRGSGDYFSLLSLADHGPVYFMAFVSTSRIIHNLVPGWSLADGRHLTNYAMFLVGVSAFCLISRRFMARAYAWITTLLFATQPLLFGHAFINQKDIPFMTLFLASLAVGLAWLDKSTRPDAADAAMAGGKQSTIAPTRWERIKADWDLLREGQKRLLLVSSCVALLLAVDLLVVHSIENFGRGLVVAAFYGQAGAPIQRIFEWIATDAFKTPLDLYLAKYDNVMILLRQILPPVLVFSAAIACSVRLPALGEVWGFSKRTTLSTSMLAAGALLGLAICVRQIGVFAGGLISLGFLLRRQSKAVYPLILYWVVAACVTVATWPYLWPDPVGRLIQSVLLVGSFPSHSVLFQGQVFSSTNLPWTYFPTLAGLELTEPVIVLVIVGFVLVIWRWLVVRRATLRVEHAIVGLWGVLPPIGLLFFGVGVYGNIRQLLFALPPFFILAGKALEYAASTLRFRSSGVLLAGIALFPGIIGIARLHPYEYTYFSLFAGGTSGADGEYQLDSWCTSYREAVEVVNSIAEAHATVLAIPQSDQVAPFLRADLRLVAGRRNAPQADFIVTCTYRDSESWRTDDFKLAYEVERQGAVFARVWKNQSPR